jgi:hypothetical protein
MEQQSAARDTNCISVDAVSGEIVDSTLTSRDIDDGSQVATLLDQVDGSVGVFMGDGAYDSADVYAAVEERSGCPCDRSSTSRGRYQLTNFPHPA